GGDLDRLDDQLAGHLHGHHPAAGRCLDHLVLERLLGRQHVLLHLLGRLEQLLHVGLFRHQPLASPPLGKSFPSPISSSASDSSRKARTSSSPESVGSPVCSAISSSSRSS